VYPWWGKLQNFSWAAGNASTTNPGLDVDHGHTGHPLSCKSVRHAAVICAHAQRAEIEEEFVNWVSPGRLAKKHGISRDAVCRHAHALSLMEPRRRNVRAALEKIIERACDVEVTATAVVSAVSAYARINARGEWVERTESVNLNELFNRMSTAELEAYAKDAVLPSWFEATVGATTGDSQKGSDAR
jgi:hypothetical protein